MEQNLIHDFYTKLQVEVDFKKNKYTNGLAQLLKKLLKNYEKDDEFLKLVKTLKKKTPLAKPKTIILPYLAFKNKNNKEYALEILTIFVYKFYNLHMNRYFPQDVDEHIWELTKDKIDKRSYFRKFNDIFSLLTFFANELYKDIENIKSPKIEPAIILKQVVSIRNKLNQVIKAFAKKYYKIFEEYKNKPKKKEIVVSLSLEIQQKLFELKNESESFLKNLIKHQNPNLEISTKFIVFLIKKIDVQSIDMLTKILEKILKDDSITEKNLFQIISKNPRYKKERKELGTWMIKQFETNKKLYNEVKKLSPLSKSRITKYFLLTLYRLF